MDKKPVSQLLVIFGASGDLTFRKLVPAVYDLYKNGFLCSNFAVLGVGRTEFAESDYRAKLKEGIEQFSQLDKANADKFLENVFYTSINTKEKEDYKKLLSKINAIKEEVKVKDNIVFYMATPPSMFPIISQNLKYVGLHSEKKADGFRRIIIEKPFGTDLESAQSLNSDLQAVFKENQLYRIDHYLGKETVQNLLVTRFSNSIFEPLWNRNYISHIEITASEKIGVGSRGGYYDQSGAMRDMFQNHLLQLLAFVAMEAPAVIRTEAIRNEVRKVMQSLRPITEDEVDQYFIRGQYTSSKIRGEEVNGYREEVGVGEESRTETFLAAKVFVENWRWSGVPFYVRTGKHLPTRVTEIVVNFKKTPHSLFRQYGSEMHTHNSLIIRIQPDEGILLNFGMKLPGAGYKVKDVGMDFHYNELNSVYVPTAYERLLLDCILGDQTLFSRGDAVEDAWKFVKPIQDAWNNNPDIPLYGYPAGTWGPPEAENLISEEGYTWRYPCKNLANNDQYCEL